MEISAWELCPEITVGEDIALRCPSTEARSLDLVARRKCLLGGALSFACCFLIWRASWRSSVRVLMRRIRGSTLRTRRLTGTDMMLESEREDTMVGVVVDFQESELLWLCFIVCVEECLEGPSDNFEELTGKSAKVQASFEVLVAERFVDVVADKAVGYSWD